MRLIDTTNMGQNGPGSNGNENVLYTLQGSRNKGSLSDVQCHTQGLLPLQGCSSVF